MSGFVVRSHPNERAEGALKGVRLGLPSGRWSEPEKSVVVLEPAEAANVRGSILVDWCGLDLDDSHDVCVTLRDTLAKRFRVVHRVGSEELAHPLSINLEEEGGVGTLNGIEIGFHLLKRRDGAPGLVVETRVVRLSLDPLGATVQPRFRTDEEWLAAGFPARTGWAFEESNFGGDVGSLAEVGVLYIHERLKEALTSVRPEGQGLRRQLQCAIGVDVWADLVLRAAERLEDSEDDAPVLVPLRETLEEASVTAKALRGGDPDAHSMLRASLQARYFEEEA